MTSPGTRLGGRPKRARTKVSAHYEDVSLADLDAMVESHPKTKRADALRFAVEVALSSERGRRAVDTRLAELSIRYGGTKPAEVEAS